MVRLPRFLPRVTCIAVACSFVTVPTSLFSSSARAQEAQPPASEQAAPAQPGQAGQDLVSTVEDFWHYGKIARYDLAKQKAEQILQHQNPREVLEAFEQVTTNRHDNLEQWLLRWQAVPEMQDVTTKIIQTINAGHRARRSEPKFITDLVERLNKGERAYQLAIARLRDSGELAVPIMLDYLRDPNKRDYHTAIRRGLRDLGRPALNPLVAATEMQDVETLVTVVGVLGDIGYDAAVPYLVKLANHPDTPSGVKAAAIAAVSRMGFGDARQMSAADLFYDLAEKFYYDNAAIVADVRDPEAPANVWYWSNARGLIRKEVPPAIFNEIMSMREAEYALKLGSSRDATSLWLAANYKREVELPEGATDPTREQNQPDAHYYGVTTGPQYLNTALSRTLNDRNYPVSYRIIRSMQQIVGQSNLLSGAAGGPGTLVNAMQATDRLVRFEAAFALAAALPRENFAGQEAVVPLLAEALSQTGTPSLVIVMPNQDQANAMVEAMKAAGYTAVGATSADAAVGAANTLPNVDVIIASEDLGAEQVNRLFDNARTTQRLRGATRIVITKTPGSPFAARAATDPTLLVTQASDPNSLKAEVDRARTRGSTLAVSPEVATEYALRAGQLLAQLSMTRGQVLELSAAEQAMLAALHDARPDVVKAAGNALGFYSGDAAQAGLLAAASAEKAADDVKVSLYKSLANNARFYGNKLNDQQVQTLEQAVTGSTNLDVRSSAAEARGALNLPVDQAKTLIIQQSEGTAPIK